MPGSAFARANSLALALLLVACAERRPTAEVSAANPSAQTRLDPASVLTPAAAAKPGAGAPPSANASAAAPSASSSANLPPRTSSAPSGAAEGEPAQPSLFDAEGTPLPQTEDRPRVDSAAFEHKTRLLFEAIVRDDPRLAHSAFFPVVAYEQVKAVAKPARDWQQRLMRAFERDVHEYHRRLGRNPEQAKLVALDVPDASARWMKPGSEGNRVGYFRVLRSRLRISTTDGNEQVFEVTSMISWRGEWYVVHLHGF